MSEHDPQAWLQRRSRLDQADHRPHFNAGSPDAQFQRDRARIVHAASFRALQSKTQVLGLGENDFYRTRLTHSLEVAQIGSGIVEHLLTVNRDDHLAAWLPSSGLMEATCLAHDLGHPPFGHGGEVALNYAMLSAGGFEGNGQTLRILSRLGEFSERCGIDVTRRTLLGVLKYPVTFSQVARYETPQPATAPLNLQAWHPPKCVYDDEADVIDWVFAPFSQADRDTLTAVDDVGSGHLRSRHKALDTSVMEIADDIAYGIHDLEDALALRLITPECWHGDFGPAVQALPANPLNTEFDFYSKKLLSAQPHERKHAISRLVHHLITAVSLIELPAFGHPLLRHRAVMHPDAEPLLALCKRFVFDNVIKRPEVLVHRHRGQQLMLHMFAVLEANPEELLPRPVLQRFREADNSPRVLCDYLSGLTDVSAVKLHRRLTLPGSGSVFDLI
ncbi:MAG: anti-phage deoxyguanosine triphosphatase [Pseudomonadota bacterium]